jgi:carbonic anhydrase
MSEQINISRSNIEGKCDLKCSYNFHYKDYTSTAINSGSSIMIKPQETGEPSVTYNKHKYRVFWTTLHTPSTHLYNDKLTDAEIAIIHMPENGGKPLVVNIPIKASSETSSASSIITKVINDVATSAPARGNSVGIGGFNIQKIVPSKPYINYDNQKSHNIVFTMIDAIPLSNTTLDKLKQVIQDTTQIATGSGGLYYNSSGPNTTKELGDGIYISCNPTGSSTETTEVTYEKEDTSFDFTKILEDSTFIMIMQIFFACLIFILVCYLWSYGFSFIDGEFASKAAAKEAAAKAAPAN